MSPSISALIAEAIALEDEAEKQLDPSLLRQVVERHAPRVVLPEDKLLPIQRDDVSDIPR